MANFSILGVTPMSPFWLALGVPAFWLVHILLSDDDVDLRKSKRDEKREPNDEEDTDQ